MIEYKYKKKENKFTENGHTMFETDVLQRLKRLAYLEDKIIKEKKVENLSLGNVIKLDCLSHDWDYHRHWKQCKECLHTESIDN